MTGNEPRLGEKRGCGVRNNITEHFNHKKQIYSQVIHIQGLFKSEDW